MTARPAVGSTVEQAFALARSGSCRSMDELRRKLKAAQCDSVDAHLSSGSLSRQLQALLRAAPAAEPGGDG